MYADNLSQQQFSTKEKIIRFLCLLLAGGILCGILLSRYINTTDIREFSSYFLDVNLETIDKKAFFTRQFLGNLFVLLLIFGGSFSLLGLLRISFLTFSKGVQIGFSCVLFLFSYDIKGIAGIVLVLIPQVVLDLLFIAVLSYGALTYAYQLLRLFLHHNTEVPFSFLFSRLLSCLCIAVIGSALLSFLKSTLFLYLIRLFHML